MREGFGRRVSGSSRPARPNLFELRRGALSGGSPSRGAPASASSGPAGEFFHIRLGLEIEYHRTVREERRCHLVSMTGWRPERSHPGGRRRLTDAANDAAASTAGEIEFHDRQRRIRGWFAERATFFLAAAERAR